MHIAHAGTHLSDAELIRHLDGEGDATTIARREDHLRDCAACAARAHRFGQQSGTVRAWLVRADTGHRPASIPQRRRRSVAAAPWLRAAAIVLLLAAPLTALPPVRHWVAERVGLADDPAEGPQAAAADARGLEPGIRFTPAPGSFTVRVDAPAPGSTLTLGRSAGADAVLRGALEGGPAPVVSDDALRLPPSAAVGRVYDLRLPASVDAVLVVVDGRTTRVSGPGIDAGRTVSLSVNR
ncbi:MAG TPA: hypothetical protein VMM12_14475 [Longimicrobiales bacterium]|nr:hypothetical protein [Longimicrobiales bacterium]